MNPVVLSIIRGLHDVFSALWAGGLLVLALVILPVARKREGKSLAGHIQNRLRRFIWPAIGVLIVTGIVLARIRTTDSSLISTPGPYRAIFAAKLISVAAMICIAAIRQYFMFGRKVSGTSPAVLLAANSILAVTTLMLSGSLTVLAGIAQRGVM